MASSAQAAAQGEADHNDSRRKSKSVKKGLRREPNEAGTRADPPVRIGAGEVIGSEAEVLRRMFADTLDGVSQRALAAALSELRDEDGQVIRQGVPTVKGRVMAAIHDPADPREPDLPGHDHRRGRVRQGASQKEGRCTSRRSTAARNAPACPRDAQVRPVRIRDGAARLNPERSCVVAMRELRVFTPVEPGR